MQGSYQIPCNKHNPTDVSQSLAGLRKKSYKFGVALYALLN
ncbi:Hypothetical protein I595_2356 [Croceitalea dokdonensis DOKDO 023]|uniref:Uncharacterized protein n=1 Tax=Croceitalea dokdonensis DOKDO 023 TaxID=1300341 RepID=A0A0P7AVA6_9FLAO|nr:Hypothetical protein I595_2356 [Croceitalea dokdonensis DOKDO 023]